METTLTRNQAQEKIVQIMYSFLILENTQAEIDFIPEIENICECSYDEIDVFVKEVLLKSLKNQTKVINYISKYLINWQFSRLNTTIQAILITSVVQYALKEYEIDKAVIINNAVKFAKKFGDGGEKDYKFVNAILDKCLDGTENQLSLD